MIPSQDVIKILAEATGVQEDKIGFSADEFSETYSIPMAEGNCCFYQHPVHGICTDLYVKWTANGIERDDIDWLWGPFNVETAKEAIEHFHMILLLA